MISRKVIIERVEVDVHPEADERMTEFLGDWTLVTGRGSYEALEAYSGLPIPVLRRIFDNSTDRRRIHRRFTRVQDSPQCHYSIESYNEEEGKEAPDIVHSFALGEEYLVQNFMGEKRKVTKYQEYEYTMVWECSDC